MGAMGALALVLAAAWWLGEHPRDAARLRERFAT